MDFNFIPNLALSSLTDTAINDWIGPAFILLVAAVSIVLLWKRQLAAFFSFLAIAAIAGIFIFFGSDLFGKNGNITKAGKDVAKKVNTVDLSTTTFSPDFLKLDR